MSEKWIFAGCILLATALMFTFRYQAVNDSGPGIYVINRLTGETCLVRNPQVRAICTPVGGDDWFVQAVGLVIFAVMAVLFMIGASKLFDKLFDSNRADKAEHEKTSESSTVAAKGETLGANLPIKLTAELVKNGAYRIARGTVKFTDWSAEMVADFGEKVRPYLRDVYTQSLTRARMAKDAGVRDGPRLLAILETGPDPEG